MAGAGFEVVFEDMTNGARAYKEHGDDMRQKLEQWKKFADLDPSVFGNLAVSSQWASGYAEFFSQITNDITKLYQALQTGAKSIAASATVYSMAEQLLTSYLSFLKEAKHDNKYLNLVDSGKEP